MREVARRRLRIAWRPAADAQGVHVTLDMADSIELPLERARVERVFINLIGNALEAMPSGGGIRISAHTAIRTP